MFQKTQIREENVNTSQGQDQTNSIDRTSSREGGTSQNQSSSSKIVEDNTMGEVDEPTEQENGAGNVVSKTASCSRKRPACLSYCVGIVSVVPLFSKTIIPKYCLFF